MMKLKVFLANNLFVLFLICILGLVTICFCVVVLFMNGYYVSATIAFFSVTYPMKINSKKFIENIKTTRTK